MNQLANRLEHSGAIGHKLDLKLHGTFLVERAIAIEIVHFQFRFSEFLFFNNNMVVCEIDI